MATLQAATTSTGAIVSDAQAVRQLCENHCFGTLNWEVDEEGELIIWGYDSFEVYEARDDGFPDYDGGIVTHEFLRLLADLRCETSNALSRALPHEITRLNKAEDLYGQQKLRLFIIGPEV